MSITTDKLDRDLDIGIDIEGDHIRDQIQRVEDRCSGTAREGIDLVDNLLVKMPEVDLEKVERGPSTVYSLGFCKETDLEIVMHPDEGYVIALDSSGNEVAIMEFDDEGCVHFGFSDRFHLYGPESESEEVDGGEGESGEDESGKREVGSGKWVNFVILELLEGSRNWGMLVPMAAGLQEVVFDLNGEIDLFDLNGFSNSSTLDDDRFFFTSEERRLPSTLDDRRFLPVIYERVRRVLESFYIMRAKVDEFDQGSLKYLLENLHHKELGLDRSWELVDKVNGTIDLLNRRTEHDKAKKYDKAEEYDKAEKTEGGFWVRRGGACLEVFAGYPEDYSDTTPYLVIEPSNDTESRKRQFYLTNPKVKLNIEIDRISGNVIVRYRGINVLRTSNRSGFGSDCITLNPEGLQISVEEISQIGDLLGQWVDLISNID